MRITGGRLSGRRLRVPREEVRPTTDRVRGALFSIVAARIPGARFLDLFAGSGAVGLEAWSRGADSVCWVECKRRVLAVLRANVAAADVSEGRIVAADAVASLKKGFHGEQFDIIFADPPYDWAERDCVARSGRDNHEQGEARDVILDLVRRNGCLAPGGLLIVEQAAGLAPATGRGWQLVGHRKYGRSSLTFYEEGHAS